MDLELHSALRQRRVELGLTQREVAIRSGIPQARVSAIERGSDVTVKTLLKLVAALEMELLPVPREAISRVRAALVQASVRTSSQPPPSLLDLYGVPDDEEEQPT
jgi:transcriptional regulator with XRE-family HTH domain